MRDDRDGLLESRLETAMWRLLKTPRLPCPTPQFKIYDGIGNYRPDFAYPAFLVAVEGQSWRWHGGALERWRADGRRINRLQLKGWIVLQYTWDDIHFEGERVISEIQEALRTNAVRHGVTLPF
jgi:very-short-patch-repair endonuclease